MAMITAIELDDLVAFGETAREADGAHAGFRAGVRHANFFYGRHGLADEPGHGDFQRIGDAEAGAVIGGGFDGGNYFGMTVAEDSWSPGEHIIHIVIAI